MGLILKEMISIGENRLITAGVMSPKVDAELLYMDLAGIDKTRLFMEWSREIDDKICEEYFERIARRAGREPLQYITGKQSFMGIDFTVNEKVLIPRPETELMVEHAIKMIRGSRPDEGAPAEAAELLKKAAARKKWSVLDLCCGSGAIGVTIANRCMNAKVTATDISPEAVEVAKKNAAKARVKVRFSVGDLFSAGKAKKDFDMIISNPPYVKTMMIPILQEEVKDHEPVSALDGGTDGLDFYRRIIEEAPQHLKKKGLLILETGHDQGDDIRKLVEEQRAYEDCVILKDYNNQDRVCIALAR